MSKKILSLLLSVMLIATAFTACNKPEEAEKPVEPETAKIVETSGTYENINLSFKIPVGWKAEESDENAEFPQLTCETKQEGSYAPFISFHSDEENTEFLKAEDFDYSSYYTKFELLENVVKQLDGRDVLVTRFMGMNAGTTVYVKGYMFNDSGRTYSIALTSPDETQGIDELYTVFNSFKGKPPVATTTAASEETTTAPESNFSTGNFSVKYPETWTSDVTGKNKHVTEMQYWYGRRLNDVPIFIATEEIDGMYPYISVLIGYADEKLLKWDDDSFGNLSASFKNYEQGKIERSTRNGSDMVTLNYSAENEEGKRVYMKQVLFNQYDYLFVITLYAGTEDSCQKEFQEFLDTFYVLDV